MSDGMTDIIFFILAAVTLIAAFQVVFAERIMHSALWLGLSFFTVAGVYLLLHAEFVAAAQVLVYVGAITTMIIYGIMLSNVTEIRGNPDAGFGRRFLRILLSPRRGLIPMGAATGIALVLITAYRRTDWPNTAPPAPGDTVSIIGDQLFTKWVLPFEIASVLLLVAVIGAIVLALREDPSEEQKGGQAR